MNIDHQKHLPRTRALTRAAICKALNSGANTTEQVANIVRQRWPQEGDALAIARFVATAVPGQSLPASDQGPAQQFLSALRAVEVLPQLGAFETEISVRAQGLVTEIDASLVAQGRSIPLHRPSYFGTPMPGRKVAALAVINKELLQRGGAFVETALQAALFAGVAKVSDGTFLAAAVATTPSAADGVSTPFEAMLAVDAMIDGLDDDNSDLSRVSIVANPHTAAKMLGLRNSFQQSAFPEIAEGKLRGRPLLLSRGCPRNQIIAVDAGKLVWASGVLELSTSTNATVEMSDAPAAKAGYSPDSVTAQASPRIPLFQLDGVAVKVIREYDFKFVADGCVSWIENFSPSNSQNSD